MRWLSTRVVLLSLVPVFLFGLTHAAAVIVDPGFLAVASLRSGPEAEDLHATLVRASATEAPATLASGIPGPARRFAFSSGVADFPLEEGELVTTTFPVGPCGDTGSGLGMDPNGTAVWVYDVRLPGVPPAIVGANWPAPKYADPSWTPVNLGLVFGLALDDANPPNIYVAATTAYGNFFAPPTECAAVPNGFGPDGPGAIYKINGISGAISSWVVTGAGGIGTNEIPNTRPALGNIAFDSAHQQFFVTNHEDGRIYRVDMTGTIQSIFDPFAPDGGAPGFAPLGERLWGIQVYQDRVYFSVWLRDSARQTTGWNPAAGPAPVNPNNSIWSIALDGSGDFLGAEQLEIVMPYLNAVNARWSNPVSDISFTPGGDLLTAEHTMGGDYGQIDLGHTARVLEYITPGTWTPSPQEYWIGSLVGPFGPMNCAGGIDYDCGENVWSTGDVLLPGVYGLQRVPNSGNTAGTPVSTSLLVGVDNAAKGGVGDVEVYLLDPCGQGCMADPSGMACVGDCLNDPALPCVPSEVILTADGQTLITECDCLNECHVEAFPAITCVEQCPNPADPCELNQTDCPDGTQVFQCACPEPQLCDLPADSICAPLQTQDCFLSSPGQTCEPTCVQAVDVDGTGQLVPVAVECGCDDPMDSTCGPVSVTLISPPPDQEYDVRCLGECPMADDTCQIFVDGAPTGLINQSLSAFDDGDTIKCDCASIPPPTCPEPDGPSICEPLLTQDCTTTQPGQDCVPVCVQVTVDATGLVIVTAAECTCDDPTDPTCGPVQVIPDPVNPDDSILMCEGTCPIAGDTCLIEIDGMLTDDTSIPASSVPNGSIVKCTCDQPPPPVCPEPNAPSICEPLQDPDCITTQPGFDCLPVCVEVINSGGQIPDVSAAECTCNDPDDPACGPVTVVPLGMPPFDFDLRCTGECMDPDEVCQVEIDGMKTSNMSILASAVPDGSLVKCTCGPPPPPPTCPEPGGPGICEPLRNPDCETATPGLDCVPLCIEVDNPGGQVPALLAAECTCDDPADPSCGPLAVEPIDNPPSDYDLRCLGECINLDEICQIEINGNLTGSPNYLASEVPDLATVKCTCGPPPPPAMCPEPGGPGICEPLRNPDCLSMVPGLECVPLCVNVFDDGTPVPLLTAAECTCDDPTFDVCGPVQIIPDGNTPPQDYTLQCEGICEIQGELCQVEIDGVATGESSVQASAVDDGATVKCICAPPPIPVCPEPAGQNWCKIIQQVDCQSDDPALSCEPKLVIIEQTQQIRLTTKKNLPDDIIIVGSGLSFPGDTICLVGQDPSGRITQQTRIDNFFANTREVQMTYQLVAGGDPPNPPPGGRQCGPDRFCVNEQLCYFDGLPNIALGSAVLSITPPDCNLRVSNIGSSGKDGVSQDPLPNGTTVMESGVASPNFSLSRPGTEATFVMYGDGGALLSTSHIANTDGQTMEVHGDISPAGVTMYTVQIMQDGELVGEVTDLPNASVLFPIDDIIIVDCKIETIHVPVVNECMCFDDECGPVEITPIPGTGEHELSCAGACPAMDDECQVHVDGLPTGEVAVSTADVPVGAAVTCECADCEPPPANMTAWWPLDEVTGTLAGELINANTGSHVGGPLPLPGQYVDNALCFDGVNDYVDVPDNAALNFGTGDFSIDAWIRTIQTTGVRVIADKRVEGASVTGYSLFLSSGNLAFQIADGSGSPICTPCPTTASCTNYSSGVAVADGQWHHVAVTINRSAGVGNFYVDGAFSGTFNIGCHGNSVTNSNPLRVASRSSSVSGLFNGCIDEVELFNRELNVAEVQAIYQAGVLGKCKPGACCWDPDGDGFNDACIVTSENECLAALAGTYHGDGTACLGTGACCFGITGGSCVELDGACCADLEAGAFQGVGSICEGDSNNNDIDDVCECIGDIDNDGFVSITDLLVLLGSWGPCAGCPADLNNDAIVNILDLLVLLANWGPC